MGILDRFFGKKKDEEELEVPEAWIPEIEEKQQQTGLVKLKVAGPPKIMLPKALGIKRGVAWFMIILNFLGFLSSSWSLGIDGVPFFMFFGINTMLIRDYLYTTRPDKEDRYIVQPDDKKSKE